MYTKMLELNILCINAVIFCAYVIIIIEVVVVVVVVVVIVVVKLLLSIISKLKKRICMAQSPYIK